MKQIISVFLFLLVSCTQQEDLSLVDRSLSVIPDYTKQDTLKVMVIDTGIDCKNKELTKYTDPKWCAPRYDGKIELIARHQDQHGHGSHITGIIISKACKGVEIVPCRYHDVDGKGFNNLVNTVQCINDAISEGVNIINYSSGGASQAKSEKEAIRKFISKGGTFVSAAGNDGHNLDLVPYYPASYRLANMTAVGSLNRYGEHLPSSNYAPWVEWELGQSVESWLLDNRRGTMSGTSQASAVRTSKLVAEWCASRKKKKK